MKSLILFFVTWAAISVLIAALLAIYESTKGSSNDNVDKNQKQIVIFSLVAGLILSLTKVGLLGTALH